MGATIEKVEQKSYTDASGNFYEGMKREDAEGRISLFFNKTNAFCKIDKDGNGVLSKFEITSEIEKDIEANRSSVKWCSGLGIVNALIGMSSKRKKKKKTSLFTTGICLFCAIKRKLQMDKLEERLLLGHN